MDDKYGCRDGGCLLALERAEAHTNGGCRCLRDVGTKTRIAITRKLGQLHEQLAAKDAEISKLKGELDDAKFLAIDIFDDWRRGYSFDGEESHEALLSWYYERWPWLRYEQ